MRQVRHRTILGPALAATILAVSWPGDASARPVEARAPALREGDSWVVLRSGGGPALSPDWERRVFWDLRPFAARGGRRIRWSVVEPARAGLGDRWRETGADRALCAAAEDDGAGRGCLLFRAAATGALGPLVLWSEVRRDLAGWSLVSGGLPSEAPLRVGAAYRARERVLSADGAGTIESEVDGRAVAEGLALVPAGPEEIVLLREEVRSAAGARLRYRFVTRSGFVAASLEGDLAAPSAPASASRTSAPATERPRPGAEAVASFRPDSAILLVAAPAAVNDAIAIPYPAFHAALVPGTVGLVQYSLASTAPLASVDPGWTSVAAMIAPDATGVAYRPDPDDPSSEVTLPEVWDFSTLKASVLDHRNVVTVRDDLLGSTCLESCAARDLSGAPADGTWQEWLKIDRFLPGGAYGTRDVFTLNDNDTGANPSIDVPYLAQDELDLADHTQICFQGSAGGASRLLKFFQFTGPDPASAAMRFGDTWTSGVWTSCNDAAGLRLTLASVCGDQCYPGCSTVQPRARGMLGSGAGFRATIVDDGYVRVAAGNYVPALLMRQDTDLQAGRNLLGTCNLGTQRERFFDYFWIQERYGLLAQVSSPTDTTGTLPPDDWSSVGNATDGVDVTWGPFPPWQIASRACLAGTLVRWALPADGSNLSGSPGVADWGYVVSWGDLADPEALADWSGNPNHTPLPGELGYLAAPPGAEPTAQVITGWAGSSVNATVTTALRYADPGAGDVRAYRSAAFYKVAQDPARLDPAAFVVGEAVAPLVSRSGDDLLLAWPAVPGAASYSIQVFDLATKQPIACPVGLDCAPAGPQATHAGGAASPVSLGYAVLAVDPCGARSAD